MKIDPVKLFAALAHETRLRCLVLLDRCGELCVCELTDTIGAAQPHISRHLAQLREVGLVADRRDGLWIHYRIHPDLPAWAREVLTRTAAGLADDPPYREDRAGLKRVTRKAHR
ncbi:metalloregulator ArsR/SmtB family transcription factor [Thioalkalicoccus limnaeus]|uniref:Metalloregulator ArsR/SmtB family transcription factor n=1 Tax=Thioalkalicoccus limnaeus TaxID=120681 RepID=A0ABV4BI25_9GAMM